MKIAIIGMGLMGASLARVLKEKKLCNILATLHRKDQNTSIADQVYFSLEELVKNCDMVILCTPISCVIPLSQEIHALASSLAGPLLVLDIASVKNEIAEEFEKLSCEKVEFIATHPMAGSEKSGFENSRSDLFLSAPWIITPHGKNHNKSIERVVSLIKEIGSKPQIMQAKLHDTCAAMVSHLPYILSSAYVHFVEKQCPKSLEMKGPGFCSFTRLSNDNALMHAEIAKHNKEEIAKALDLWIEHLINIREKVLCQS